MSDVSDGPAQALPDLDEPGDAELISAVRGGDLDAYGLLFERHAEAARRLSRQLVSAGDVDDLVSEGFAKVLGVLQRGGGPDLAFRAYLLTSIRRLHIDKMRSGARLQTTDDLTPYDPGIEFEDTAVSGFENAAAAKAFQSLPERWQQVLWHTEVEGQKPADIAPLLGMSANSVSALAYRAREGLRQAFVTMHAQDATTDECAEARSQFGAYVRGGVSKRDAAKIEAHLKECRECTAIYLELAEVNSNLGAVLAPIVLGTAAAGYLAAHAGAVVAAKGGVLLFLDRGKDWVLHNPAGRATGGVAGAAAAAVVVAAAAGAFGGAGPSTPAAVATSAASAASAPSAASTTPSHAGSSPAPAAPTRTATKSASPALTAPAAKPATSLAGAPIAVPTKVSAAPPASDKPVILTPIAPVTVPPGASSVSIDLAVGARDPKGRRLGLLHASIAPPGHGSLVVGTGGAGRLSVFALAAPSTVVTYVPHPGWRGTDRITYTLTNHHGGTVSGSVQVITPNTPPVARDDHIQAHVVYGDRSTTVDVLANDSDINGDPLTVTGVSGATHGTATVAGNKVVFTPTSGYVGDATFTYAISDGHGGTASATGTISYGMQPDAAPVVPSFSVTVSGDGVTLDLASQVSDPDGDPLTIGVGAPAHGSVTPVDGQPGRWRYQPDPGFAGTDTVTYSASDGVDTTTGTVTVHVQGAPLELANVHGGTFGYEGTMWVANGLTSGETATFTMDIHGFLGWNVYQPPASCTSGQVGSTMTVTCPGIGENGEFLHADFFASDGWTLQATLTDDAGNATPASVSCADGNGCH